MAREMKGGLQACDDDQSLYLRNFRISSDRTPNTLDRGFLLDARRRRREPRPLHRFDVAPYPSTISESLTSTLETIGCIATNWNLRHPRTSDPSARAEFSGSTDELVPRQWTAPLHHSHTSTNHSRYQGIIHKETTYVFPYFDGDSHLEDYLDWEFEIDEVFTYTFIPQEKQVRIREQFLPPNYEIIQDIPMELVEVIDDSAKTDHAQKIEGPIDFKSSKFKDEMLASSNFNVLASMTQESSDGNRSLPFQLFGSAEDDSPQKLGSENKDGFVAIEDFRDEECEDVIEMEVLVEGLEIELSDVRNPESSEFGFVDEWKKKTKLLESCLDEVKQPKNVVQDSLVSLTKQLKESNFMLNDAKSEVICLKVKAEALELKIERHKEDLDESDQPFASLASNELKSIHIAFTVDTTMFKPTTDAIAFQPTSANLKPPPMERQNKSYKEDEFSKNMAVKKAKAVSIRKTMYSVADMQVATNSFSVDNLIGEGSLGRVYRTLITDGKVLAVKKKNSSPLPWQAYGGFIELVSSISQLCHSNISELVGYCSKHGQHLLVYEFYKNGSIQDPIHLIDEDSNPLSWNTRVKIALGTTRALEYLHEVCSPSIVHKKFNSANILMDAELNPHLSECGLSSLIPNAEYQAENHSLASGYSAPEAAMSGQYTMKSDVQSFVVIMLELLTGRKPFDSSRPRSKQYLVRWATPQLHDIDTLDNTRRKSRKFTEVLQLSFPPKPGWY